MDNFWNRINHDQFQEIAYEYAKSFKPEFNWTATKKSYHSYPKDEFMTRVLNESKNSIKKDAWYEAKYSKNSNLEIPLGKIAATVLVGFNNTHVESILIVTNAKFATKTIFEIQKILNNRVIFVSGEELKSWLLDKKQKPILQKYGLVVEATYKQPKISLSNDVFITKPNIIYNAVSTSTETLIIGEKYVLQCVINIPFSIKQSNFKLKITNVSQYISINKKDNILINQLGTTSISIPFTPIKEGNFTGTLFSLHENQYNVSLPIKKTLSTRYNKNIILEIKSQINCEFNLLQNYHNFIENSGTFLFSIKGSSGSGKSWVIENFINSKQEELDNIYLKFGNNELANSKLLIELLVFIIFGNSFVNSKLEEEDIENIELINNYNKHHTTYLRYLIDREDLLQYTDLLLNTNVNLIPYSNIKDHRLLVLDDLQFLNTKSAKLLFKILKSLIRSNHTIFIITAQRESNLSYQELENFIIKYSYLNVQKIKIETNDVRQLLENYKVENLPKRVLSKLIENIFILKKFISILKNEKEIEALKLLSKKEVKILLANNDIFYNEIYELLNKDEKKITDIIYFFNTGIKSKYLLKKFSEKKIDNLILKKVIKYDYKRQSYIPFHDIYLEKFISLIKKNSKHLYDYAVYQKKKKKVLDYLSIIPNFPTKFIQNKDFFIKQISKYHEKQNFFNVYYVLKRYFSLKPEASNIGSPYEAGLLFFYYGYASFNVGTNDGRDIYAKTYTLLKNNENIKENSLAMIALAEMANCDYWNLKIQSVESKYELIYTNFESKPIKNKYALRALFTICIRFYTVNFLTDKYDKADDYYRMYERIFKKEKKDMISLLKLTKAIYNFENDAEQSYNNLKIVFNKAEGVLIKTYFKLESYLYKMGCFLNYNDVKLLENTIKKGQENNLIYTSQIMLLQLAQCYAMINDFSNLERALEEAMNIRDFPSFPKGIYYNLRALVYLHKKKYNYSHECLLKQEKCFKELGNSYTQKISANKKLIALRPTNIEVDYVFNETKLKFYIESRF